MFCSLKKSKGGIFLGLGLGIFSVMFIPTRIWLIIISIVLILSGLKIILCKKKIRR